MTSNLWSQLGKFIKGLYINPKIFCSKIWRGDFKHLYLNLNPSEVQPKIRIIVLHYPVPFLIKISDRSLTITLSLINLFAKYKIVL